MHCAIHTIEKTLFDGEIKRMTLPTKNGEITVLENHLPIITITVPGTIQLYDALETATMITVDSSGFLEVRPENDGVTLLLGSSSNI